MSKNLNSTVDLINRELKNYGSNEYGDPIFRCVFSDDQIEKRKGTFNEFYGKIFIRTITCIKEVQKYPWIKRRWIIERWAGGSLAYHRDLEIQDGKNGVYICVYVFQDKFGQYLPPVLWAAELVAKTLLNPKRKSELMEQDIEFDKKADEQELNEIELDLKIRSDEAAIKDPKSIRESMSIGYTKRMDGTEV